MFFSAWELAGRKGARSGQRVDFGMHDGAMVGMGQEGPNFWLIREESFPRRTDWSQEAQPGVILHRRQRGTGGWAGGA